MGPQHALSQVKERGHIQDPRDGMAVPSLRPKGATRAHCRGLELRTGPSGLGSLGKNVLRGQGQIEGRAAALPAKARLRTFSGSIRPSRRLPGVVAVLWRRGDAQGNWGALGGADHQLLPHQFCTHKSASSGPSRGNCAHEGGITLDCRSHAQENSQGPVLWQSLVLHELLCIEIGNASGGRRRP